MNYLTELEKKEILLNLEKANKILITGHINPDGDCLGSSLAVYNYLLSKNKEINILMPNDFPDFLKWLPNSSNVHVFSEDNKQQIQVINEAELIFCLDYNELKRIGNVAKFVEKSSAYKIMIDHHPSPQYFCNVTISDTKASSASELVYYFLKQIDYNTINPQVGECVFTGIIMDTGNFQHNSSNPETFETVAELLKIGINKDLIINNLFRNSSENKLRLMGHLLNKKMYIMKDHKTAYIYFTKEEQEFYNYQIGDTESFVNLPLQISNINLSVFFMESDNYIKISFRSKDDFDVNLFARKYFNGGGHKNAAGGKSYKSMNSTIVEFENIIEKLVINY